MPRSVGGDDLRVALVSEPKFEEGLTAHSSPAILYARSPGFNLSFEKSTDSMSRREGTVITMPAIWQLNRKLRQEPPPQHSETPISKRSTQSLDRLTLHENLQGLRGIFWSPFTVLLIAFPLGILSGVYDWGSQWTFWLNFLALIPLAKLLGDATEELDASLGSEVLSGLINASFGNAVEMIITVNALRANLFEVVKTSLLGSVLSNMLLVLGMSFFAGGLFGRCSGSLANVQFVREKEQVFLANGAMCSVSMLLLSSMSFTLPTVFKYMGHEEHVLELSRVGACVMFVSYIMFLIFQLVTHPKTLGQGDPIEKELESQKYATSPQSQTEQDGPSISLWLASTILGLATLCTAISSEFLVDAVEDVVSTTHLTEAFIGVILLPIVGNACEHMAAVRFALQERPGLSVSIAVGSSTQIALFVVPFSVIAATLMGKDLDLNFGGMHTSVMVLSVLILMSVVLDGRSNWLAGWMLMSAYVFIAAMYWYDQAADLNN